MWNRCRGLNREIGGRATATGAGDSRLSTVTAAYLALALIFSHLFTIF
jgi:hypothetical protein